MNNKNGANFVTGTGRRKASVASAWIYPEKGDFYVNEKPISEYFDSSQDTLKWLQPFHTIGIAHPESKYRATIKVKGGGTTGQVEAVRLAIAKALIKLEPELKSVLRQAGLITTDTRKVESKKPFLHKARKRPQFSKR